MADRLGVDSVDREGQSVIIKFRPQAKIDPVRLVSLIRQRPDLKLIPPAALRLALERAEEPAMPRFPAAIPKKGAIRAAPSWWTARARAGEVKPGFSKEAILRTAKDDPRTIGGVFERVGALLSELLDQV
jgi:hypothetical protein